MKTIQLGWLLSILVAVMVLGPASGPVRGDYAITDLGDVGTKGFAYAINDAGMVVGAFTSGYTQARPAVWENSGGTWTKSNLPTIAGTDDILRGEAEDVNASGAIVGWSWESVNWYSHASVWQKVGGVWQVTDLGGLATSKGGAYGISTAGVISGSVDNRCMVWNGGVPTDISGGVASGGFAKINPAGTLIAARLGNPYQQGLWENVGGTWQAPTNLGTLGGSYAEPRGINDAGKIVGVSSLADGNWVSFLYDGNSMVNLGTLGPEDGEAWGINDAGDIVGSTAVSGGARHAYIYQNSTMTDLNTLLPAGSAWTLTFAGDINNLGQIAGIGTINGETHLFVMTPVPGLAGTVQFENYNGAVKVLVQVDLTPSGGGSTTSQDVIIPAAGGTFNLPNLASGTYDIGFKACSWLRKVVTGVSITGPTTLATVTLVNGDLDGDNAITSSDLSIVLTGMDQSGQ